MSVRRPATPHTVDFDIVLDEWPGGAAGDALRSLIASGDLVVLSLPYGFVGLKIIHSQTLLYMEAGHLRVKQVVPAPPEVRDLQAPQYQYRARSL